MCHGADTFFLPSEQPLCCVIRRTGRLRAWDRSRHSLQLYVLEDLWRLLGAHRTVESGSQQISAHDEPVLKDKSSLIICVTLNAVRHLSGQ